MKALVKKYPVNADREQENTVYPEPWDYWIDENGFPLTGESRRYALCEECPDNVKLTVEMFDVSEHVKTVKNEYGEDVEVKYYTAKYVGGEE